ncbi:MAG: HAD family hydrolase [Candidatus Omnitrophica bacterium]|nr:HAD family hydrolase [Candidatus Omnitrophota bacterium]
MTIKAITFDFWKTLYQDNRGETRHKIRMDAFVRHTGLSYDEVTAASRLVFQEFERVHKEEQVTLGPHDKVRLMMRELKTQVSEDAALELAEISATAIVVHPPDPVEGAVEAVKKTAEKLPIGIISDTATSPGRCLRQLLERDGILNLFGTLTFSDEVGVAKPQAPMFELTAQNLGVEPEEMLHIGDLEYTDILGIQRAGGKAGLFAGYNDVYLEETKADYVFRSWAEFLVFLEGLP